MPKISGQLVKADGIRPVAIAFDDSFQEIQEDPSAGPDLILPGTLDWHNHGGGGGDVMDGEPGIRSLARTHLRFGMTGFLATTVTASDDAIENVIEAVQRVMSNPRADEARCFGVHLEGPFLSEGRLGAQPPMTRPVDPERVRRWFDSGVVRVMTYAPEQDPAGCLPTLASDAGVRLQLGHTGCVHAQAAALLQAGHGVTHVFNAMRGVHHREPGLALASLLSAEYAEIICDGVHVVEPAFHLAHQSIPSLYAVTDATAAAGMPDGAFRLGSQTVEKRDGAVRLADGTLAGSAATAEMTVSTLRQFGLSWPQVVQMTSERPSQWLGLGDAVGIREGLAANFVVYRSDRLSEVWMAGQRIYSAT